MASSVRQRRSCASRSTVCEQTGAIEANRRDIADLAREPPLDAARDRALGHDDEMVGEVGARGRAASRLAIKAREHPRRHAKIIEQDAAEIAQAPREIALAPVALAARHRARFQHHELAPLEPAHQIDVLHQRERTEAAEPIIEIARDEQTLIAVGQREHEAAEADQLFDRSAA